MSYNESDIHLLTIIEDSFELEDEEVDNDLTSDEIDDLYKS